MTSEKLKDMLRAVPFQPFNIRIADGQSIRVDHPEFAVPSPSGRTVIVFEPGDDDDHMRIIDLLLVTTLEPVRARRNGRGRAHK